MANNLKDHLKEVADAIRAKKGTTDLINPQDFATEIEGISGGGESGGSGESSIEFFALSDGWAGDLGILTSYYSCLVKASTAPGMAIAPVQMIEVLNGNQKVTPLAIAIDMALVIKSAGQEATLKESILGSGITEEALAKYRITKEQFYNLNA